MKQDIFLNHNPIVANLFDANCFNGTQIMKYRNEHSVY